MTKLLRISFIARLDHGPDTLIQSRGSIKLLIFILQRFKNLTTLNRILFGLLDPMPF